MGRSHPSNLGAPIAKTLSEKYGGVAFVVDPPVVDELDDVSRITGLPGIERRSAWHALNQKAVAKRFALVSFSDRADFFVVRAAR